MANFDGTPSSFCPRFFCLKICERYGARQTGILGENRWEMRSDVECGLELSPHSVAVGSGLNDLANSEDGGG